MTSTAPVPNPTRALPFAEFVARLLRLYQPPLRSPHTLEAMVRVMASVARTPGLASTADLTTDLLALWVARRSTEVARNTVIGELGYVSAACSYAVEGGWLDRQPFASRRLRLRADPAHKVRHHPRADVARVLSRLKAMSGDWVSHRLYALASLVAYTGVRRNEALFARVEDVRLAEGFLSVVARGASNPLKTVASSQPVPIPPELAPALSGWLPRAGDSGWLFPTQARLGPWTGGNPGTKPLDRLRQAGWNAGVKDFTFQSLRHSWATHAETAWGLSEPAIQRVLRHTTPFTQSHYRHADLDNLREIGSRVSYAASVSGPASPTPPPCPAPGRGGGG